ncbi:unnamed protein product, partial [Allacma fusca]
MVNRKLLQRCGPGLHWNKDKRLCDWPSSANCQPQPPQETVINNINKNNNINKHIINNNIDNAIREQPCEEGTFTASPTECEAYFVCVHGENLKRKCQGGLYWNQNGKNCDWPAQSGCTASGAGTGPGQGPPMITPGVISTTTYRPWTEAPTRPPFSEMPTMPPATLPPRPTPPPSDILPGSGKGDYK